MFLLICKTETWGLSSEVVKHDKFEFINTTKHYDALIYVAM